MAKTEIPFSKSKIGLRIIIFVFVIFLCVTAIASLELDGIKSIITWTGLVLCSTAFFYHIAIFFYQRPGLIIND